VTVRPACPIPTWVFCRAMLTLPRELIPPVNPQRRGGRGRSWAGTLAVHDRGRVLVDLAVMIADGPGHPAHPRVHPDRWRSPHPADLASANPTTGKRQETTPTAATDGPLPCPDRTSHQHHSIKAARSTRAAVTANHRG
jgi:hypothetical protein